MIYTLIIEINIKEKYFIKSILSIINHKLKEYNNIDKNTYENTFLNNYDIKWLSSDSLSLDKELFSMENAKENTYNIYNTYNTDSNYDYNFINDNTNIFFYKLEKYIKNIYPEFGNKWNIEISINKIEDYQVYLL